jgi:GTPase SAR1 family protein
VTTRSIEAAKNSDRPSIAIVGLKGSGKTTLYRFLAEDWGGDSSSLSIGLANDSVAFESYFDKINCLQFDQSVRLGIMLFVLRALDERVRGFEQDPSLRGWLVRKEKLLDAKGKVLSLLKRFQGLSIMGVGLSLKPGEAPQRFMPLTASELEEVAGVLDEFGRNGPKIHIVIDDPDRLFTKGTNFDPHLLAGYILGTNYIASRFPFIRFTHVIKSSVFDTLQDVEEMTNLPYDYFNYVSWSKEELISLLRARMDYSGILASDVFEDAGGLSMDALLSKIRNGPRDLLRYIEIILKSSPDAKVSDQTIAACSAAFKQEARRQMTSVYGNLYEGIESFSEYVFSSAATITVESFYGIFQKARLESKPAGVNYGQAWLKTAERALRALVDAGLIDVKPGSTWVRPFEETYFRFDARDMSALIRPNAVFT